MDKQGIIDYLNQQENNSNFYKSEIERLKGVIESMKTLEDKWIDPHTLDLTKTEYTKEEIITAFMKAKVYEGLETNKFSTVLDTFITMLDSKHHSQNK